jgi:integrase
VEDLRRLHVEQFTTKAVKTYAPKTVNFDLSTLFAILQYGVRREYLQTNVASHPSRPRIKKHQWRILTPQEIQLVDGSFDNRQAQLIFRTLVRTGMRRGEIRHLKTKDIDFPRNALRVVESKTDEGERWMALPGSLVQQLQAWCEDKDPNEYVFPSSLGNPFNPEWYANAFNRALAKAGVTDYVRPFHDMRHTSLTNEAATAQSNPMALMARAGHRSMDTTRQYLKLAGVLFPDQAEALDRMLGGWPN